MHAYAACMHVCVIGLAQPQARPSLKRLTLVMRQKLDRIGLKYLTVLTKFIVITFYL